jgi:hypothetical protein
VVDGEVLATSVVDARLVGRRAAPGLAGLAIRVVVHRSPAGPHREVRFLGASVCARCAAVMGGLVIGIALAPMLSIPIGVAVLLATPAVADAVMEKVLGRGHAPRRLLCANALLGVATALALAAVVRAWGPLPGLGCLGAGRCVTMAIARSRRTGAWREAGAPVRCAP